MRPLEIFVSLANLLAFMILSMPLPCTAHWIRYTAPLAVTIAGIQILVEGSRRQMVPAYILAGLILLVWLLQISVPVVLPDKHGGSNRAETGLLIGLGLLGLAVSIGMPVIFPVFRFPMPTGPYEIGTLTYHWVDPNRPEIFVTDPNARRELMVQVWYPAKIGPASSRARYIPDADALASAFGRVRHTPAFLYGNLKYITTHAVPYAPAAADKPAYPVLIFIGGVTGFRQMNTYQFEELVSHGYIVVAIDQPYVAAEIVFPDGRHIAMPPYEQVRPLIRQSYLPSDDVPVWDGQRFEKGIINYLAQDVIFTLDQLAALNEADPHGILTGRMDMQRTGAIGFSMGGIVVGKACQLEPRLRACLIMDAPMTTDTVQAGLQQPGMWITRDADTMRLEREQAGGWSEEEINAHQTSMHAVFNSLPEDGYFVQVAGIFHLNFSDVPYWSPLFSWMRFIGPIDPQRAFGIINVYSLAFFDRHLNGLPATLLDEPSGEYPEVLLEVRHP